MCSLLFRCELELFSYRVFIKDCVFSKILEFILDPGLEYGWYDEPPEGRIVNHNILKGFATFWEFSFYGQKKVADYEYHSLFAEKIHFHT